MPPTPTLIAGALTTFSVTGITSGAAVEPTGVSVMEPWHVSGVVWFEMEPCTVICVPLPVRLVCVVPLVGDTARVKFAQDWTDAAALNCMGAPVLAMVMT